MIQWSRGDVFSLPGGTPLRLASAGNDSVLWIVTNEPQLAFEHLAPPRAEEALVEAAHFPAATIRAELDRARARLLGQQQVAGLAVVFSSQALERRRNISPTLTLAMNQPPPGGTQSAHSHNSVAVSLVVERGRCYSRADGVRKDWSPYVTMVTPSRSVHSHHNEGGKLANWLTCRTAACTITAGPWGFASKSQRIGRDAGAARVDSTTTRARASLASARMRMSWSGIRKRLARFP